MHAIKQYASSFVFAYEGLRWAFMHHANYRIHALLSVAALVASVMLQISNVEWLFIIITITLGFVIESINTAVEVTCDAIDQNWREDIKIAKDVSAAAMLIYSIGAVVIAIIIFIPKLGYI
ncbi:hypothetical protein A2690_02420 [Candidatus Roizmanbacteria bacterium RIFCSPHIGHO2_01_FULL_39_12b]|uniref:Diacylglycerol kinase n=1 Tax=Candidatus Roizmanbacteria bacterium RIFCSPHIGHO2_01_FULL_39_12b TaxID=1802030 RepID=A0A1F7GEV7_9BACT|nr:MAG: hypothetical protein A2690_02420 [Candidatus Roizmanbacteria bacterium RIFCSPHIGHO2_01_FULL_39_12b]OGK46647.1 MAG: hypothetical protein A3B46_00380 [Candidatus Roizmanbacteria bacterium RIFCSPLOWO2_01_FULL_39_19]